MNYLLGRLGGLLFQEICSLQARNWEVQSWVSMIDTTSGQNEHMFLPVVDPKEEGSAIGTIPWMSIIVLALIPKP